VQTTTSIPLVTQFEKALQSKPFELFIMNGGTSTEPMYSCPDGIGRLYHNYNEFGYSKLAFRFRTDEQIETNLKAKLGSNYKIGYKQDKLKIGEESALLVIETFPEKSYASVTISGYLKESDAEAIGKMGEFLSELEKGVVNGSSIARTLNTWSKMRGHIRH
jgi:hypothetical protein